MIGIRLGITTPLTAARVCADVARLAPSGGGGSLLVRTILVGVMVVALGSVAQAFPGVGKCPDDAKREVVLIPAARADTSPCDCETIITCQNLDKKTHRVTCQFFTATGSLAQSGNDATRLVVPGAAESCATDGPDPLGIRFNLVDANITADIRLVGRVCSSTKKLACDAVLSCNCSTPVGPIFTPLTTIIKKQKGD